MSQAPAHAAGAFSAPALQPAIVRTQQSDDLTPEKRVEKIARLLQQLPKVEQTVKHVEVNYAPASHKEARLRRDAFVADLRNEIEYAVNVAAFDAEDCTGCQLPSDPLKFAAAVNSVVKPASCSVCGGAGVVLTKKKDKATVKATKRIKYWGSVLDDYHRCCKIRANTSEANQAYLELEAAHVKLLRKFGSEKQTSLEGADAEQGVRQGFIDAALRFDPLRKEGATFGTVAYNWCRRNSRARHFGQKRAGVYAPSIDAEDHEGRTKAAMIMSSEGALGTFSPSGEVSPELILDLREQVSKLPELQRKVIECELQGMTATATADKLDLTKSKVRKLKTAAFATLKSSLAGYATALDD